MKEARPDVPKQNRLRESPLDLLEKFVGFFLDFLEIWQLFKVPELHLEPTGLLAFISCQIIVG